MDKPVYYLDIQIWEDSLADDHDHENDHDKLVSAYGYVTGTFIQIFLIVGLHKRHSYNMYHITSLDSKLHRIFGIF